MSQDEAGVAVDSHQLDVLHWSRWSAVQNAHIPPPQSAVRGFRAVATI